MHQSHLVEAVWHGVVAAFAAPVIGIAFAAFLDWLPQFPENATVRHMLHRCAEGFVGGAVEGFAVALIIAGISVIA